VLVSFLIIKVVSQAKACWFVSSTFSEWCTRFINIWRQQRLALCNQMNATLFCGEVLKDSENGLLLFECWKKHCGRCYVLTSRHILNALSVVSPRKNRNVLFLFFLVVCNVKTERKISQDRVKTCMLLMIRNGCFVWLYHSHKIPESDLLRVSLLYRWFMY
jgi:hypothetical protein